MKKSLLSLAVCLLAFGFGSLLANVFHLEQKTNPTLNFEEVVKAPIIETVDIEIPANKRFYAWYSLDNYESMSEVEMIMLSVIYFDKDGIELKNPIVSAAVYTKPSKDIYGGFTKAYWTKFDNKQISFKTKNLKIVEYRFEGTFFKNKTMGESGEKILHGTLQKFIKGKKVAEVIGDFAYYEPDCLN